MRDDSAPTVATVGPRGDALPRPLPDEIVRQPLIDALADRWNRRLILVEAPAGYGKSLALAQAIRDNADDPSGIDVYLRCRIEHRDAGRLATDAAIAIGGKGVEREGSMNVLAAGVAEHLAEASPLDICLHLDDVHLLGADDTAADLIQRVLDRLPTNGHLLLCGRRLPDIAATVGDDETLTVGAGALRFSRSEVDQLAAARGMEGESLADIEGWPALTRMAVAVGKASSIEYLIEEVIEGLDPSFRRALVAASLGRRVDAALLEQVTGFDETIEDLAREVPLVDVLPDGHVCPHDLWSMAIDRVMPPEQRRDIAVQVAAWHRHAGRIDEALDVLIPVQAWSDALETCLAGARQGDAGLSASQAERRCAMFPAELAEEPELQLMRAIACRLRHGLRDADAPLVEGALAAFRARGDAHGESAALGEIAARCWLAGDQQERLFLVSKRARELAATADPQLDATRRLMSASLHDIDGDFDTALDDLAPIDISHSAVPIVILVSSYRVALCARLGRTQEGVAHARSMRDRLGAGRREDLILVAALWQDGHADALVRGAGVGAEQGNARLDFHVAVHEMLMAACVGEPRSSDLFEGFRGRRRERAMAAIARAAAAVVEGDEVRATREIEWHLDDVGAEDPMTIGELLRFFAYGYVLVPDVRHRVDRTPLGPKHRERRTVCRALLDSREGRAVDWGLLPDPPSLLCALPLRWSTELACRAHAAGVDFGVELGRYLLEAAPKAARELFEEHGSSPVPVTGAAELLCVLPAPPTSTVHLHVFGRTGICIDGHDVELRRRRVRELLGLIALERRVPRSRAIAILWPAAVPNSARNNLRVNLTHLRDALEPNRRPGEASSHLGEDARVLWLQRSDRLSCDLWTARRHLDHGRDLERAGDLDAAMVEYARAVDLWRDELLTDLRGTEEARPAIVAFEHELAERTHQLANWAIAHGEAVRATHLGERLLRAEPLAERPYRILITAAQRAGDLPAAHAHAEALRGVLDELEAEPSAATKVVLRRLMQRTS